MSISWTEHAPLRAAVPLVLGLSVPAAAATVPPGDDATTLRLEAAASVDVAPDLLVARMDAESVDPSAAEAQRRVNVLVAAAMGEAHATPGVDARATGYGVSATDEKRSRWSARQTVELRATRGPALLELAGRLQGRGLVMTALDWQVSPATRRAARDRATIAALSVLQERVRAAADALHLHVDHLRSVVLDPSPDRPPVSAMPMMMMRAGPAPQATATDEAVEATVSADAVLRP